MNNDIKVVKSSLHCFALRIQSGDDLVQRLKNLVNEYSLKSAFILTCVGSLKEANLRLANAAPDKKEDVICISNPVEIVSLVGTLSLNGFHLHMSLSDDQGQVVGGHLMSSSSCIVHTTVELVIGNCPEMTFTREFDEVTGYKELVVSNSLKHIS